MAEKTKSYSFHSVAALIALSLPLLISFIKKDDTPNLVGIVISAEKPRFSVNDWLDGTYQWLREDYNDDHWAFKESFVRLNNEFYYRAFNQIRVSQFVAGKDNYIYGEATILSYFGNDFIGDEKIREFARKCKVLQDTLGRKGISFMLAFAPGKGIGAPEHIEDKYVQPIGKTNIRSYVEQCQKTGVNYLDLVNYFYKLKDTCRYPLYARFAHHWTTYFDCLACKKIITYIEDLRHTDLPDMVWNEIEMSDTARKRDNDVLKSMNLYSTPPQAQPLAYPVVQFEDDSLKNTTRVLTVGDSYWYGAVYLGVGQACFADGQFWYYNNRVVPSPNPGEKVEAWQLDLKQSIESNKVVMVLGSDPALAKFGWGFVEDAYELYTSPATYYARVERSKTIQTYAKQIREAPVLLKKSTKKSKDLQISLDSAIKIDAMKLAGLTK